MNVQYVFYITLILSILIQFISGVIEIAAVFIKVPNDYSVIRELLLLELAVQIIEGIFYIWLAYNFTKIETITPKRYLDWIITTPSMLIILIGYLIFVNKQITYETNELSLLNILKDNYVVIIPVLLLNWLMLLFGYLGEINIIHPFVGVMLGFIPFLIYYYMIYVNYVSSHTINNVLFWYFFTFWSLYGVVAVLPYYTRNAFYNILDLFAKNFFGIFLSYIIFTGNY